MGEPGVLAKATTVLQSFTVEDHGVRFTEVQRRTGLPKSTLHRLLREMVSLRLLDLEGDRYRLSGQLFELGMRASVERDLLEVAMPFLEDLYERTHEVVHLGIREGTEVVYVAKLNGHRPVRSPSRLGGRMPLHATAIGKALLAHAPEEIRREVLTGSLPRLAPRTVVAPALLSAQLEDVVETGIAHENEESSVGLTCIAAPVFNSADRAIAAVSITGTVGRMRPAQVATPLRAAAAGITATLSRRDQLRDTGR
ncbi:IclR family transcriptional regulator [Flexivirga alba]|uniref:IclR family transcriptional regulator n=1 Tax=Flexivirga alba TaxID=702742 RepID=A0ABW2ABV0_9MICO